MNKDTIVKGLFIAILGFVIMMGCLDGEPAMLEFVANFGFSGTEGVGLGTTIGIVGLVIALAGLRASSPQKSTP